MGAWRPGSGGGGGGGGGDAEDGGVGAKLTTYGVSSTFSNAGPYFPLTSGGWTILNTDSVHVAYVPAGSTWRIRVSIGAQVDPGETFTVSLAEATTLAGPYGAVGGSSVTFTNSDGANAVKLGAIVTPTTGSFVVYSPDFTAAMPMNSRTHFELIRVT